MSSTDMEVKNNAGVKEILMWRLSAAVTWSVACQVIILAVFLLIVNLDIMHPVTWIKATLSALFSPKTLLYLLPLGTIIFAQGVICSKEYIAGNPFLPTRFHFLFNFISIRNLCMSTLHIISGVLTAWLYLSLLNTSYSSMIKDCGSSTAKCLTEENVYLVVSGLWIGFYYFIKQNLFGVKNIFFPVIEQNRFIQVKSSVSNLLLESTISATLPVGYYMVLYYFYGSYIRNFVLRHSYLSHEDPALETVASLLKPSLVFYPWLLATLFIFTMATMELLFEVNLTRQHAFPVTSSYPGVITLGEGICIKKLPIIQHLACLDLFKLSSNDNYRRSLVFTLSQPGGHPYNWNAVVTASLCLIDDFVDSLKEAFDDQEKKNIVAKSRSPSPVRKLVQIEPKHSPGYDPLLRSPSRTLYEPTVYRLRNMRFGHLSPSELEIEEKCNDSLLPKSSLYQIAENQWNKCLKALCKAPGIHYFFGELPDAKLKYILSQGQPVVWTAQGISLLAAASFREDSYGIVQKDLPAIISSLLKLKQIMDRVGKTSLGSTKRIQSQREQFHGHMHVALKSAAKRSLYNICTTYGPFINELPLSNETKINLMAFMVIKEC